MVISNNYTILQKIIKIKCLQNSVFFFKLIKNVKINKKMYPYFNFKMNKTSTGMPKNNFEQKSIKEKKNYLMFFAQFFTIFQ